ncbi:reverse transcriptase domain-containing protein [Streptomyces sp. NPDC002306]
MRCCHAQVARSTLPRSDRSRRLATAGRVPPVEWRPAAVRSTFRAGLPPVFHPDSYGYRPGRSAIDAVGRCRERCWKADWVIDLDIRAFFDSVQWDLVLKAVAAHTDPSQSWVLLYVRRWLAAPLQLPDGTQRERSRGTPQGSSVSPVLANLFLHYAFDAWMARNFPAIGFERYVDDAVVHCVSERQARFVLAAIGKRMAEVGLELHPEKTRIVYCQDANRRASYEHTEFTFLGFSFRTRSAPAPRSAGTAGCSDRSSPPSAGKPCAGSVPRCGPGGCTTAPA